MALSTSTTAALQQFYDTLDPVDVTYQDNPFFAMVAKKQMTGYTFEQPIYQRDPVGRSADFTTALTNAGQARVNRFSITDVPDYAFSKVTTQDILASKGAGGAKGAKAFFDLLARTMQGSMHSLARSIAVAMYGTGTGSIGNVASLSLPNFGLTRISDITNFEEGDTLVASATDGSALRSGSIVIDQITGNYLSGFTLHIGSGSITSFANGDFLYKQGDAANGGSNVRIAGVPNWTGTGTLFGVTRTTDQRRLSVLSPDYSSSGTPKSPLEALTDMAISIKLNGGNPDLCFVNPLWYATLANELAGRVLIVNVKPSDSATISFDGIQVSLPGAGGVVKVIPDINCPSNKVLMITSSRWCLFYRGSDVVSPIDQDGKMYLRDNAADGIVFRSAFYGNLACSAPGHNAYATVG